MINKFEYDKTDIPRIYTESRQLPAETVNLWLNTIKEHIAAPIKTILDLGCGEGRFSVSLASKFNAKVYGVDPSRKMLSIARKRNRTIEGIQYLVGSGERIPLDDQTVSMVFMSMAYHHLDNVLRTASEIRRVLISRGYLVIRNATEEDIDKNELFNFFPSAKQIDLERMPKKVEVLSDFETEGFDVILCHILNQLFAQNYQEYYEKISKRGLSALALISDSDFERGLGNLRQCCEQKPKKNGIYEKFHLFIFRKK